MSPAPSLETAFLALKLAFDPAFYLPDPNSPRPFEPRHTLRLGFGRDLERLRGIGDAVDRIRVKSRSFWIASAAFEGRLKFDLILL